MLGDCSRHCGVGDSEMVPSRRSRNSTTFHEHTTSSPKPTQSSNREQFRKAVSALAQHKPHELPKIPELSGSSRTTLLKDISSHHVRAVDSAIDRTNHDVAHETEKHIDTIVSSASEQPQDAYIAQSASRLSDLKSLASSAMSLPLHDIPRRKSSVIALSQTVTSSRRASLQDLRSDNIRTRKAVSTRRHANSPVRNAIQEGAQSSETHRASPSRTFIRTTTPFHLLDNESSHNPRVEMSVRLPSPLFVGGGTIEGQIELRIDANSNKKISFEPLFVSKLSVDVVGVEEVEDGRRHVFLCLATELFDARHPPPATMVLSQTPEKGSELCWRVRPATATIPFCINLPLKLGPPPYSSRRASIRYLLCPSAATKVGEKRFAVRQVWTIQMLTIHDPEKALASLPNPLLATDTLVLKQAPVVSTVKLTAGLHRQTWVSGGALFTDIHVVNSTEKVLKRLEVCLEKSVLWFSHSAASTVGQRRNNLRLPAKIDTETVSKNVIKRSKEWAGIAAQVAEVRTCELEVPKGHVTVGNGRYFEVRYFIKVTVVIARGTSVSVQLPVTIIHINSLDIMPNSLAQVAASVEAKRSMALKTRFAGIQRPHLQGRAFTAARRQSFEALKQCSDNVNAETLRCLTHEIDESPRQGGKQATAQDAQNFQPDQADENDRISIPSCFRHLRPRHSCYHCHLLHTQYASKTSPNHGPKLPRLQVSTSGLGFSESEFEIPPDSPRKVMLSERDRQMINQERELRMQRQWSQQRVRTSIDSRKNSTEAGFTAWKNVALFPKPQPHTDKQSAITRHPSLAHYNQHLANKRIHRHSLPVPTSRPERSRSGANFARSRASFSDSVPMPIKDGRSKPARGMRSINGAERTPWSGCSVTEDDVFSPNRTSDENSNNAR